MRERARRIQRVGIAADDSRHAQQTHERFTRLPWQSRWAVLVSSSNRNGRLPSKRLRRRELRRSQRARGSQRALLAEHARGCDRRSKRQRRWPTLNAARVDAEVFTPCDGAVRSLFGARVRRCVSTSGSSQRFCCAASPVQQKARKRGPATEPVSLGLRHRRGRNVKAMSSSSKRLLNGGTSR